MVLTLASANDRLGNSSSITDVGDKQGEAHDGVFDTLSGGEMRLVHVCGDPQGVGRDRQTGVQTGAGREERGVHHVEIIHFVRPVLWVQHTGFGIGTETARAADVGQGRVVFGGRQGDFAKRLQHLFQLA